MIIKLNKNKILALISLFVLIFVLFALLGFNYGYIKQGKMIQNECKEKIEEYCSNVYGINIKEIYEEMELVNFSNENG